MNDLGMKDITRPRKRAERLVEKLGRSGASIERIPPSEVVRTLTYNELSDFLDTVVYDIYKCHCEAFDSTQGSYLKSGNFKAYLYMLAMHHFKAAGVLITTAGIDLPDCAGAEAPVALLAWLSRIGTYVEGDTYGRARYTVPSATPVVGNNNMSLAAASETTISTGLFDLKGVALNTTYNEVIELTTVADATTVIANWITNGENYSGILRSLNYPTAPLWRRPPSVVDGSFFAFPSTFTDGGHDTNYSYPLLASPFIKWDAEMAGLYWNLADMTSTTLFYPSIAPRMFIAQNMAIRDGLVGGTAIDAFVFLKVCFVFICRNNLAIDLDMPTVANLRNYHGDKLSTFWCRQRVLDLRGYHEAVGRAINQLAINGATFNVSKVFASLVVHEVALLRKIMISGPCVPSTSSTFKYCPTSMADSLTVLAPIAQLLNEIGPVVLEGNLIYPAVTVTSQFWYSTAGSGWTATASMSKWAYYGLSSAQTPAFTFTAKGGGAAATFDAAWIAGYGAAGGWAHPLFQLGYLHRLMVEYASSGVAYGKGELLFPASRGPRGGLIMFSLCPYNSASDYSAVTDSNSVVLYNWAIQGLASHVALSGPDICLGFVLRPFGTTALMMNQMKYVKDLNWDGSNPYLDRYISDIMSPGGVFNDLLSAEMEKMHGTMDGRMGLMTPKDNVDQCLWGAIKGIAGTIAQVVQPSISAAAGIGCGAVPGVGQFLRPACSAVAKNLVNYVADTARVSTNRQEHKPVSKALDDFEREIEQSRVAVRTMAPEQRRPIRPDKPAGPKPKPKVGPVNLKPKGKPKPGAAKVAGKGKSKKKKK